MWLARAPLARADLQDRRQGHGQEFIVHSGGPTVPEVHILGFRGFEEHTALGQRLTLHVSKAASVLGAGLGRILKSRLPIPAQGDQAWGSVCLLP